MPSCPQGLRGGWRWGEEGGRKKEPPLLFAFAIATTSVKGLILKGKRVWICIVTRSFCFGARAGIELYCNIFE